MFCKTIILSNSNNLTNNAPKGILTLSKTDNGVIGKIRLYNLTTLPLNTKIGIYSNNEVYTATINKKPHHFEFNLNQNLDLTKSLYCALIDNTLGDKRVVLEGGNFNGFYFTDSPPDAVLESKDEELDKAIDNALKIDDCQNCEFCEYKKYFYEHTSNDSNTISPEIEATLEPAIAPSPESNDCDITPESMTNELVEHTQPNTITTQAQQMEPQEESQIDFLNDIIYQLDEMFVRYPEDDVLKSIIPDSRFIRVDGDNTYVLGMLYEDKMLKYIAYGVPATYNSNPPADLGKHYQWLPLNPQDPLSDGYFMIYQDAQNGNIVEINFE